MDEVESVYTDIIMEHSTSTYNKHELENATDKEHGHNPSCGDDITLEIIMNDNIIEDLAFTGSGCAISQASTSIMIDLLKGKTKEVDPTIEEVEKMEMYTLDVIYYKGDLILKNGSFTIDENKQEKAVTVDGLSLSGTTWSVRKSR